MSSGKSSTRNETLAAIEQREPIIQTFTQKPVLENVIENKNVEIYHKPVVQEIHEQKIVEIQKVPTQAFVEETPIFQQSTAPVVTEAVSMGQMRQHDVERLEQFQTVAPVNLSQTGSVQQYQEGEVLSEIVHQEVIERHVIPQVTEVRDQRIVNVVSEPIVRHIIEPTVVRECGEAPVLVQSAPVSTRSTIYLWEQAPVRSLGVSYNELPADDLALESMYSSAPARHVPLGRQPFLMRKSYGFGLVQSPRRPSQFTPMTYRDRRLAIQHKYRVFLPEYNIFRTQEPGMKTSLQLDYEQFKSRQSISRSYRRYYYNFGARSTKQGGFRQRVRNVFKRDKSQSNQWWRATDPYMEHPTLVFDSDRRPGDLSLTDAYNSNVEESNQKPHHGKLRQGIENVLHKVTGRHHN